MRHLVSSLFCIASITACVSWEAPDLDGDGLLASEGDCDDLNGASNPGAEEIWYDGVDQNCDGNDGDKDGDGFDSWQVGGPDCWDDPDSPPPAFLVVSSDWQQPEASEVHPDAAETWYDGVDQNCDEASDFDQDGDGYLSSKHADAEGLVGDDCIDGSELDDPNGAGLDPAEVNPGVTEDTCYDGTNADCDSDEPDPLNTNGDYLSDNDCDGDGWMLTEECDDSDPAIEPNDAPDPFGDCIDANCDGNDGDEDGDGYVTDSYAAACPNWQEMDSHIGAGDCWDSGPATSEFTPINSYPATTAAAVNPDPGTAEVYYDGMDQNCDGLSDFDADQDGEDSDSVLNRSGQTGEDCDDTNSSVRPDVLEDCATPYDDNCNDNTNDLNATTCISFWQDADGDLYGEENTASRCYCEAQVNVSLGEYYRATNDTDCNDSVYSINPGATENTGDGVDSDCNGQEVCYVDADNDGYANGNATTISTSNTNCTDRGEATNSQLRTDCDDSSATIYPGATEYCDGHDDDCDGSIDEDDAADATTWYADTDNDTYGDNTSTKTQCNQPSGYVTNNTDCDDSDGDTNPGADEYCDGHDDDCDKSVDENDAVDATTWYRDADNDGYGTSSTTKTQCNQPSGYVTDSSDCLDTNGSVNPAATEVCDSANTDEDCDGGADDNDPNGTPSSGTTSYYIDGDSDGYGDENASATAYCDDPANGMVSNNDDCDDSDGAINPDGTEICDSFGDDEDCDGGANDSDPEGPVSGGSFYYVDSDSDGYGDENGTPLRVCSTAPSNYVADDTDCNDSNSAISPGAEELACDSIDSDCDGSDSLYDITDLGKGDLVISEVMMDPDAVSDSNGEWFEVYNASSKSVDLNGLILGSNGHSGETLGVCLGIDPGDYLVFTANDDLSTNGGIASDYDYTRSQLQLSNSSDTLSIETSSGVIDEVEWTSSSSHGQGAGVAAQVHTNSLTANLNDYASIWCGADSVLSSGDYATPGAANSLCGESIDTAVQGLFNSYCTSCHSGSSPSKGLDLSSGEAWAAMYLVPSTQDSSYDMVAPGDATNSWLQIKLEGTQGGGNGSQMPIGGSALSSSDLSIVEDWIDDGAWR